MGKLILRTVVIFRKWQETNGVIALFLEEPASTESAYFCQSYMKADGHGSADPAAVIWATKPAQPEEYADLVDELKKIGYTNIKVVQRQTTQHVDVRRRKWHQNANQPNLPGV